MPSSVSMRRGMVKLKGKSKKKTLPAPETQREAGTREQEWLAHGAAAASVGWAAKNAAASSGLLSATQWVVVAAFVVSTAVGAGALVYSGQGGGQARSGSDGAGTATAEKRSPKLSDTPAEKLTYRRTALVAPGSDDGVGTFPGALTGAAVPAPTQASAPDPGAVQPASNPRRLDVVGTVECTIPPGNLRQMEEAIWRCANQR